MDTDDVLRAIAHLPDPLHPSTQIARRAGSEIERLRYVLGGVRDAIKTGRNEPLVIWKEQIDIALGEADRE